MDFFLVFLHGYAKLCHSFPPLSSETFHVSDLLWKCLYRGERNIFENKTENAFQSMTVRKLKIFSRHFKIFKAKNLLQHGFGQSGTGDTVEDIVGDRVGDTGVDTGWDKLEIMKKNIKHIPRVTCVSSCVPTCVS